MRTFAGIEVSSSHAAEVENPKCNYPIALLFVVLINILGSLSVAAVVPPKKISLVAGIMERLQIFLQNLICLGLF